MFCISILLEVESYGIKFCKDYLSVSNNSVGSAANCRCTFVRFKMSLLCCEQGHIDSAQWTVKIRVSLFFLETSTPDEHASSCCRLYLSKYHEDTINIYDSRILFVTCLQHVRPNCTSGNAHQSNKKYLQCKKRSKNYLEGPNSVFNNMRKNIFFK